MCGNLFDYTGLVIDPAQLLTKRAGHASAHVLLVLLLAMRCKSAQLGYDPT